VLFATEATQSTKAYEAEPEEYDSADESASDDNDDDLPRKVAQTVDNPTPSDEGEDALSVASSHTEAEHENDMVRSSAPTSSVTTLSDLAVRFAQLFCRTTRCL
jgi:hypothetical protein